MPRGGPRARLLQDRGAEYVRGRPARGLPVPWAPAARGSLPQALPGCCHRAGSWRAGCRDGRGLRARMGAGRQALPRARCPCHPRCARGGPILRRITARFMNDATSSRPPYLAAVVVALLVLTGYVLTLAPTVTFWDAGEFIAAAKVLGIPHPPGTPLFVLIAHVWGTLIPIGEFAYRTNLLSAVLSAGAAGFLFLVAHETLTAMARTLDDASARMVRLGGAAAAALIGAFSFTNWQNSNETEVYGIATFTIAAICWLCLRWRARRGTPTASRLMLLIVYLGGVSMGNHLLALLVG